MQTVTTERAPTFALTVMEDCDDAMPQGWPRFGAGSRDVQASRAKALKDAQYLGPWCSRCGKRGKDCRNAEACRVRQIPRGSADVSLPRPPEEWLAARGYVYHSTQGVNRSRLRHMSAAQQREMHRHYAYELAMGKPIFEESA